MRQQAGARAHQAARIGALQAIQMIERRHAQREVIIAIEVPVQQALLRRG